MPGTPDSRGFRWDLSLIHISPHCPLGPIALASCLNVDAVSYNAVIQEQSIGIHYNVGKSVLDYVKNQEDFKFTDGFVQLPQLPGLGVEVNRELVLEENRTPHNLSLIHI